MGGILGFQDFDRKWAGGIRAVISRGVRAKDHTHGPYYRCFFNFFCEYTRLAVSTEMKREREEREREKEENISRLFPH